MCLVVTHWFEKTAKKDIPCYKLLDFYGYTPFMGVPFTSTPRIEKNKKFAIPFISKISEGYIHSFKYHVNNLGYITYDAYIPKGTKYWQGIDSSGQKAYASKLLKLKNGKN